jgi:hypothetical protein
MLSLGDRTFFQSLEHNLSYVLTLFTSFGNGSIWASLSAFGSKAERSQCSLLVEADSRPDVFQHLGVLKGRWPRGGQDRDGYRTLSGTEGCSIRVARSKGLFEMRGLRAEAAGARARSRYRSDRRLH